MQIDLFQIGQKPGPGAYECKDCSEVMRLMDYEDELTPCPYCKSDQFILIDDIETDVIKSDLHVNASDNLPPYWLSNENID